MASAVLLSGCVIGDTGTGGPTERTEPPAPTVSTTPTDSLAQDLTVDESSGHAGVALLDDGELRTGGSLADTADAAWSTSKVPLAVAALSRPSLSADVGRQVGAAISASDNGAAEALWASLGTPEEAAQAVEDVLAEGGDPDTDVPSQKRREEFSTFGQTYWTLEAQATFASNLQCLREADTVVAAMGQIVAGQDYGLGQFDGAVYKGGWGPGDDGTYLVRQFGLVPGADGTLVPVAVSATSPDGRYESAQAVLDRVVGSLGAQVTGARGVPQDGDCGDSAAVG